MSRILFPQAGEGRVVLSGVVFTDGAAEADLGPNLRQHFEALGAAIVDSPDEMQQHTVAELRDLAGKAEIPLPSHLRKDDVVAALTAPVDHAAEARGSNIVDLDEAPQEPAGDADQAPAGDQSTPTEIAATGSTTPPSASDAAETPQEGQQWEPSPSLPSTTTSTTTGSLSLQDRRRQERSDPS